MRKINNSIKLQCPSCSKKGSIEVLNKSFENMTRGLLAINIASGIICSHSFIVYVDKNLNIRDHFIADFHIEIPELDPIKKIDAEKTSIKDIVNVDLIRLNLPAKLLIYIIKSIFLKQKIIIISDQEYLHNHFLNFFKYITKDSFETNITFLKEEEFRKNRKDFKDSMVFDNFNIINNIHNLINPKKLFIEKTIINNFLTGRDILYSYIHLRNEIMKSYELSKKIVDFVKENKIKGEKVDILGISKELNDFFKIKINTEYFNFLIDIVRDYFEIEVPPIIEGFLNML